MIPTSSRWAVLLFCCIGAGLVIALVSPVSPLATSGDEVEPAQLSVSSFERLDTGCADDVATYAWSRQGNGSYTRIAFIETGGEAVNISARTERTSPAGADLTTFRVYIDSTTRPREPTACTMGVQYRLELTYDRGPADGFLSGDDGTRVLWLENGAYSGCSSATSGSLDSECHRFTGQTQSDRTWANATATE